MVEDLVVAFDGDRLVPDGVAEEIRVLNASSPPSTNMKVLGSTSMALSISGKV
jgi:hypothetical protein